MSPDEPRHMAGFVTDLEQWSAPVETLVEKFGPAYSLPPPFGVTALRVIARRAGDRFDDRRQDCFKKNAPESLIIESHQKLFAECEDWVLEKKLDLGAKDSIATDIGALSDDDHGYGNGEHGCDWGSIGYVDEEGNWWSKHDCDIWSPGQSGGLPWGDEDEISADGKYEGTCKGN